MRVFLIVALAASPVGGCSGSCDETPPTTTVPPDDSLRAMPAPSTLPPIVGLGEGGVTSENLFDIPFTPPPDFVIDVACAVCPAYKKAHILADGTTTVGTQKMTLNQNAVGRIVARI